MPKSYNNAFKKRSKTFSGKRNPGGKVVLPEPSLEDQGNLGLGPVPSQTPTEAVVKRESSSKKS